MLFGRPILGGLRLMLSDAYQHVATLTAHHPSLEVLNAVRSVKLRELLLLMLACACIECCRIVDLSWLSSDGSPELWYFGEEVGPDDHPSILLLEGNLRLLGEALRT